MHNTLDPVGGSACELIVDQVATAPCTECVQ